MRYFQRVERVCNVEHWLVADDIMKKNNNYFQVGLDVHLKLFMGGITTRPDSCVSPAILLLYKQQVQVIFVAAPLWRGDELQILYSHPAALPAVTGRERERERERQRERENITLTREARWILVMSRSHVVAM